MKARRVMAGLLAAVMIMNSGGLSSYASDTQTPVEESAETDTAPSGVQPADSGNTQDAGGQNTGTQNTETQAAGVQDTEPQNAQTSAPEGQQASQEETDPKGTSQPSETPGAERTLTDEESGVMLVWQAGVLPDDAQLQVDEKKEQEDVDYPAQAKAAIAARLEQEGLALDQIAFYDISLGGVQPDGDVKVKLPVPEEWTGEQDAWYIDDSGEVTYMERETEDAENYYSFLTDHFSLYAVSAGSPAEEETAGALDGEKEEEQQDEQKDQQDASASRSGDNVNSQSFADAAETYYGESGTMETASVSIQYQGSDTQVRTGDTISFMVDYKFTSAVYYNYGEQSQPLFDSYDDSRIVLHLPEGLSVVEEAEGTLQNVAKVIPPEEGGSNDWILVLNDRISSSSDSTGTFLINLKVGGNGSTDKGHVYDFGTGEGLAEIETSFTIKDRTDPDNIQDGVTYSKKVPTSSELSDLTAVSDDKWMVKKTAAGATVNSDKTKVTVRFNLEVGLENNGVVVSQASTYGRNGRVPFAGGNTITLTETPAVKDRSGNPIQAESITVTPLFGTKQAITVQANGGNVSLPVDTCEGKDISLEVDGDAPYYSQYAVEIVYPYEKFIAQYYDENQNQLEVENTAKIQYTLAAAGGGLPEASQSSAAQRAGEVTEPAALTLGKEIVGYKDSAEEKPYIWDNFSDDPVSGPVTYQIKGEDGSVPTLYTYDGEKYTPLTGAEGKVTYDPAEDKENLNGQVTVYLDPGSYIVSETQVPANTEKTTGGSHNADDKAVEIGTGETETATFYNRELLGEIRITKQGERGGQTSPLAGAVFGIYSKETCTEEEKLGTVTTASDGTAIFARLPYGQYYVKEISAPNGYIKDEKVYGPYTISGTSEAAEVESVNSYNLAPVELTKQVWDVNNGAWVNVGASNYEVFADCFEIQSKSSDGTWTSLPAGTGGTTVLSVGQDGRLQLELPVYESDGATLITYRFKETLPEGWHADKEENGVTYSEEFTLEGCIGNAGTDAYKLTMKNDRNGSIDLTKRFFTASLSGMTETKDENLTASFDLYYQDDNGPLTKYNEEAYIVKAGQEISIADLPRTGAGGASRDYYLVETTSEEGYASSGTVGGVNGASKTNITIGGEKTEAFGPFSFDKAIQTGTGGSIVLEQSAVIDNVEQKVPVVVKKVNSYTGRFVSGAGYTIYKYDNDTQGDAVTEETSVGSSEGALSGLEPGHKYIIEETKTPTGYQDVTDEKNLIVDLTDIGEVTTATEAQVYTIENRPDPTFTVTKERDNASGDDTALAGVQFEVYTKAEGADTFTRVNGYDGQPLTITAGQAQQIPAGTYYLKEIVPEGNPNSVLDPSRYKSLYEGKGVAADNGFYFGPFEVNQQQDAQTLGPVVNYSALGDVAVTKYRMTTGGEKVPLEGAVLGIYVQGQTDPVKTVTSAKDTGYASFTGLPIYDEGGNRITYTIKEISAPDGYTASDKELTVMLTPGETVTKDSSGNTLEIVNQPETSLQVTKSYYNMWEYAFTEKEYQLPGMVIALYQKNAEGNYVFKAVQTTDVSGNVFFEGLTQKDEYVAVEVCVPAGEAYMYLEPQDGKDYLNPDYLTDGKLPETIPAGEMENYSHVTKAANDNENSPQGAQQRDLVNVENWAQLQIKKYVLEDGTNRTTKGEERVINNAQFTLYMQVVDTGETELAFAPENCSVVGSYSSGTLYDAEGKRMDGWFGTDVLKSADNVVYWLVEEDAGIGASIKKENVVTLIKREGTEYKNNTAYELDGETVYPQNVMEYRDNQVTREDLENNPEYGGGPLMFSTVRIAKWAGGRTSDGDKVYKYTPLGNASFDLYLADSEGNLYEKLDTLTTGLDNSTIGTGEKGALSAWASSRAFIWSQMTAYYEKNLPTEIYRDIFSTDTAGNGYVRVALVESGAPAGYMMEKSTCYMYMFFRKADTTTEIFNDAYYVKGDGESADEDVPLTETQEGIKWALYPTQETADGGYEKYTGASAEDGVNSQYRLVNWPVDTQAVTVQKYGYEVQEDNLSMNSEELDDYYASGVHTDRRPLKVTMRLERYLDGQWQAYAYTSAHANGLFTTDDSGYFAFPNGLQMGTYRIIEVTPDSGYENIYDGATVAGGSTGQDQAAYYFSVESENVNITMYNPKKQSLTVKKTDAEGTALAVTVFTLTDPGDPSGAISGTTGTDGTAALTNIGTGTYKLTETPTAGHSGVYFNKYFEETYSGSAYNNNNGGQGNLNDLVNGGGIFLGYDRSLKSGEHGTSLQVTKVTDISNYGIDTEEGITLTVENPKKVSFMIRKQDADTGEYLNGAQFQVEYTPFTSTDGTLAYTSSVVSWQDKGTVTTAGEDESRGTASVSGEPGLYRITETKAPDDYDITDGGPKYIAMTGGLDITSVTVDGSSADVDTDADMVFQDDEQVRLKVKKEILSGDMSVSGSNEFSFTLYDSSKKQLKELTATTRDGEPAEITFDGLSQGKTYYLKETGVKAGFAFTAIKDAKGDALTADADGFYEIKMPATPTDVSVTAENTYLYAQVSIRKVDGETGTFLDGARFQAVRVDGTEEETVDADFTAEGKGIYTVILPLEGTAEETFRIYETQAPSNYLPDTEHYIEVTVGPGQVLNAPEWNDKYTESDRETNNQAMLADRLFPDYRGAYVDLVKYDNVHAARDTASTQAGAGFTLYYYDETDRAWEYAGREVTDSDGKIHFTVNGGLKYAIEETQVPGGYQGMEGIYDSSDAPVGTTEAQTGAETETRTLFLINGGEPIQAGVTYEYSAYDIPYLSLEIQKHNALDPSNRLTATAAVYEVPEGTVIDSGEEAEKFIAGNTPLIDEINVSRVKGPEGSQYSCADSATDGRLARCITAGKTYLVVETSASTSQIREDSRVQWYDVLTIEEGSRAEQTAVLKNVEGTAPLALSKTAAQASYSSLFTKGAQITYTITPTVGSNTYPLTDFTVTDQGLTAYSHGEELPFNETYLKDGYSLRQVTVGKASHDTKDYADGVDGPIYATVTFYGMDGEVVYASEPLDVSSAEQTAVLPETSEKAGSIQISYQSDQFKKMTGYALGTNFTPGSITVTAEVDQQEGSSGEKVIDQIRNTAGAVLHYEPWDSSGNKRAPTEVSRTATADVTIDGQEAAKVSVSKTADKSTVNLQDDVVYSITISNAQDAPEAMQEPFIVDLLPQGTTWQPYDDENDVILEAGSTDITYSHMRTQTEQGETGVFVFLNGSLEPGEQVTVRLRVKTENTVASYGTTMNNYVLAGSDVSGARTEDNPQGSSFKNATGNWAQSVDEVTTTLDAQRREALKAILAEQASYGYVSNMTSVNWATSSDLVVVKSAYGDRNEDAGYSTDILSTVSNGGTMHYRLSVSNISSYLGKTEFGIIDILPAAGDFASNNSSRDSSWALNFGEITRVYKTTAEGASVSISPDDYRVYYYTGDLEGSGAYQALYQQVTKIRYENAGSLPEGWTDKLPADKTQVRAFIIAMRDSEGVRLGEEETLVAEYTAQVNGGTAWDEATLNNNSWKNAVNSFTCTYSQYAFSSPDNVTATGNQIGSNQVSNTIMPSAVKVGGVIWIDRNGDGQRTEDETIDNFAGNALIQQMLQNVEVRLFTYTGTNASATGTETYQKDQSWSQNANYVFTGLDPAMLKEGVDDNTAYPDGILNPGQLKGSAPSTYTINVTLPNTVTGKFKLTAEGENNGISRDPRTMQELFGDEMTDSNFTSGGSAAVSERFYLWATDPAIWDNTKDIGLIPYRDLELTKTAADDPGTKVGGAQFTVYGPFAENKEITAADLTEENKVGTYATDENGKLTVPDLYWYQNYVVVEDSTAAGYDLAGAQATGAAGTNIESISIGNSPAWLLKTPADSRTTPVDVVTVTNKRTETTAALVAEKELLKSGQEQQLTEDQFTFALWESLADIGSEEPLQTAGNNVDGEVEFAGLTYDRPGTHTYYITEVQEDENPCRGITYDTAVYRATVNVTWTEGSGLGTSVTYEKRTADGSWTAADSPLFTNVYNASGHWTPVGTKTLTGRDMKADETFTFTVKEGDDVVGTGRATGGKDGQPADITFTEISYGLEDAGDHIYIITEDGGGTTGNGLTYDPASFEVQVHVSDNGDGTLTPTPTYPNSADGVAFTNEYEPEPISYTPVVTKTVTGNELPGDRTFTFSLEKDCFDPADGAQMPDDTEAQITVKKGETAGAVTDNNFGEITFKKAGTYTFTIQEKDPGLAGFESYDQSVWTLTVTVADDGNGNLTRTSTVYTKEGVDSGTAAAFSNTYDPADTTVKLQAAKVVNSDMAETLPGPLTFSFEQSYYSGTDSDAVIMPEGTDANRVSVSVDQIGQQVDTPEFGEITFTAAGDYVFQIREIVPAEADRANGVTYDGSYWYARVSVTDEGGTLKAGEPVYYKTDQQNKAEEALFENGYMTTETEMTPTVRKTLEGGTPPGEKTFTFELTADPDNEEGAQITDEEGEALEKGTAVVTYSRATGTQQASFDTIRFTRAGIYRFAIAEVPDSGDTAEGYTFDTKKQGPWTLTVVVKDKSGALYVESAVYADRDGNPPEGQNTAAEFTNSYQVTETTYVPKVTKKLEGDPRPGSQTFTFTIAQGTGNPADGAALGSDTEASVTVGKDAEEITVPAADEPAKGEDAFGAITFKKAGTYTFTISETKGKANGYTYDTDPWTLTVVVEDVNSRLVVTGHTYTRPGSTDDTEAAVFTNSYETTDTVPFIPQVLKKVTGEERPADSSQTFRFTLTPPEKDGFSIAGNDTEAAVTLSGNAAEGTATTDQFGAITFTRAGTYEFRIAEEKGNAPGYTYDTDAWTLTVIVEDQDSQLVVTSHTYTRDGDDESTEHAIVTNTYVVKDTEFVPEVTKSLVGDGRPGDAAFTFEITGREGGSQPADGAQLGTDTTASVTLTPKQDEGSTSDQGQNAFGAIRFIHAGTYAFEITEVNDERPGYGYDGATWILTLNVKDTGGSLQVDEDSVLYVRSDGSGANTDAAAFENTYSTEEAYFDPKVEKQLEGTITPSDKTFTFTLERNRDAEEKDTPADGAVTGSTETTVSGAGSGSFETITFEKAGTYHFTIRETMGTDPGYTYDQSVWDLEIVVEDRNSVLQVTSHTYTKVDSEAETSEEKATFTNEYEVTPTGYAPEVTKTVTGDVPEDQDATFRFHIEAREDNPEGAVLPEETEVSITGSGEAEFGEIEFRQAGTYRFDITEINDLQTGYQYDGSVWLLTVTVKDTDSVLRVESAIYSKDEITSDVAAFENRYNPEEAAYAPRVQKHLSGDQTPKNVPFEFTLTAREDNPKGAALTGTSAKVEGAGTAAFAPITFRKAGIYRFDIAERDGKEMGYTYDSHVWTLTVEVKDTDGVLTVASVKYDKSMSLESGTEAAEFTNRYSAAAAASGAARTGDREPWQPLAAALILSGGAIAVLARRRKREER